MKQRCHSSAPKEPTGAGVRSGTAPSGRAGAMALTLCLAMALGACATADDTANATAKTARLSWDYERDGQGDGETDRRGGGSHFDVFGRLFSDFTGGARLDNIALSPEELQAAIVSALAPPRHFLAAMPRSGTSRTSLAPEVAPAAPTDRSTDAADRGWGIASSNEGQITTDWQRIPGREAGVLWWKKRYDTEVRHIITVKQALHARSLSSYSLETEVRERPNANYDWAPADPELGRASFERIKGQLWESIQMQSNRKKARK